MHSARFAALMIANLSLPALAQQPAAIPVGTVQAERRPIEKTLDFVGRVEWEWVFGGRMAKMGNTVIPVLQDATSSRERGQVRH